jgi:hypothetical protein
LTATNRGNQDVLRCGLRQFLDQIEEEVDTKPKINGPTSRLTPQ